MSVVQLAAGRKAPSLISRASSIGWVSVIAFAICSALILVAIFAPWIAPADPLAINPADPIAPGSAEHLLGTDQSGRDILSRLIFGARSSLVGPAVIIAISTIVGSTFAMVAAWYGGAVDAIMARILDLIFSFPGLLVAIAAATVFGAGFWAPVAALSIAYSASLARIVRPAMLRERSLPYVSALRLQGATGWRVSVHHILPNVAPLILVQAAVGFGYAMIDVAALAFLGLGVQAPTPDWGVMVSSGQSSLAAGAPEQSLYAAAAVAISVISFNLVGERLARHFGLEDV
ncbi:ABC transporter permease [Microbacterium sp. PMB16]|uniref:ABC transporter permease n=1 Tax=Microbacterium sp. PMB16 TaxID=3120157 RepID=UPI003F4BFBAF